MDRVQQAMAGPSKGQSSQGGQMPTVEEIIALLMQGADPQKLVEMGVPPELIMQAIEIIKQQMAQEQQQQPMQAQPTGMGGEGLARQLAADR